MFGRKTREIKELNSLLMKMRNESTDRRIENSNLLRDLAKASVDFQAICDSLNTVAQVVRDMDMFPVPPAFPVSPVSHIPSPTWRL